MVEARHTPGPWHVWQATEDRWEICEPDKPHRHSHFASIKVGSTWGDEGKANAHLIAAAPDLLEALQHLSDVYEHIWVEISDGEMALVKGAWEVAERAIAKAEGRS